VGTGTIDRQEAAQMRRFDDLVLPESGPWGLAQRPLLTSAERPQPPTCPQFAEARARLEFLVEQRRRCGLLLGPAGCGKSLLLHTFREQLGRTPATIALIDLRGLEGQELLWQLAAQLGLAPGGDDPPYRLWQHLSDALDGARDAGRQLVVLLDHADRAAPSAAAAVGRLLQQCETTAAPVTCILAAGLPLAAWLREDVAPRTDLRIELSPLNRHETADYVGQVLAQTGRPRQAFDPDALAAVHEHSAGQLRGIRRLCGLALVAATAEDRDCVDSGVVHGVAAELA
jgi:type II secretory pathway predicted ATPase ExeA